MQISNATRCSTQLESETKAIVVVVARDSRIHLEYTDIHTQWLSTENTQSYIDSGRSHRRFLCAHRRRFLCAHRRRFLCAHLLNTIALIAQLGLQRLGHSLRAV